MQDFILFLVHFTSFLHSDFPNSDLSTNHFHCNQARVSYFATEYCYTLHVVMITGVVIILFEQACLWS